MKKITYLFRGLFIALSISFLLTACTLYQKTLIDQLSSKDMSELTLKLYQEGIVPEIVRNGDNTYNIRVASDKYEAASEILLSLGLYHADNQDKFLKIATKSSMVETPLEQQFKFNQIIAQELSATLSNLHDVVYAEVYISSDLSSQANNIDFASDNNNDGSQLKASVLLKVNAISTSTPEELINNAKKIVAGAVKGLTTDNIYVVIENS